MIEIFAIIVYVLTVNFFSENAPSNMFDRVPNFPANIFSTIINAILKICLKQYYKQSYTANCFI